LYWFVTSSGKFKAARKTKNEEIVLLGAIISHC
jgi:hypothetical protein